VREPEPEPEPEPVPEPEPEPVEEEPVPEPVAQEEAPEEEEAPVQNVRTYEEQPRYVPPLYEPPAPVQNVQTYEEPAAEEPAAYEPQEAPAPPPAAAYSAPPPAAAEPVEGRARGGLNPLVLGLGAVVLVLLGVMGWLLTRDTGGGGLNENIGELVVQSLPAGAQVKIDGEVKGVTPLTIRLERGAHVLEVQSGNSPARVLPLIIQGGVQMIQNVEFTGTGATGTLEIVSQPPGARIVIDGQNRGTTPGTIRDLSPGDHTVVLELRGRKVTQTVKVQAGSTSKLSVPIK
jgi:hypothetical protein